MSDTTDILESFEEYVWNYEVDYLGSEGLAQSGEIADLYKEWLKARAEAGRVTRSEAAQTAAKTRATNAKKGISQKNLTGSTKQKRWASEVRGSMIGGFSEENREIMMDQPTAASFWIENRNADASYLSSKLDELRAACEIADAAAYVYRQKHQTENGVVVTVEYNNLRNASRDAHNALARFLSGNR